MFKFLIDFLQIFLQDVSNKKESKFHQSTMKATGAKRS